MTHQTSVFESEGEEQEKGGRKERRGNAMKTHERKKA
jgi:hypothetical protein